MKKLLIVLITLLSLLSCKTLDDVYFRERFDTYECVATYKSDVTILSITHYRDIDLFVWDVAMIEKVDETLQVFQIYIEGPSGGVREMIDSGYYELSVTIMYDVLGGYSKAWPCWERSIYKVEIPVLEVDVFVPMMPEILDATIDAAI